MEKSIKVFESPIFGQVRSVKDEHDEPWFCLADVCKALSLLAKKAAQRLEDKVLSKYPIFLFF